MPLLQHGSNTYITGQLKPQISFDKTPLVYATDYYYYALVRAGKFNINEFLIKEDYQGKDKPFRLIELEPGAFERTFNTSGYIYLVSEEYFTEKNGEYISSNPVPIERDVAIYNVWEEIQKSGCYELIYYEDSAAYWETVEGGKEAYLERRKQRATEIEFLKRLQKLSGAPAVVNEFEEEIINLRDTHEARLNDLESKDEYLKSMIKGVEIDFACHIAKLQNEIKRLNISLLILFLVNFVLFFLLAINYGGAL